MLENTDNKEVKIVFYRGHNRPTVYRIVEDWRKPTKEQAETIARLEICWFNHPVKAAVTIDEFVFYFNITYRPVYANRRAEKEGRYTSLYPEFEFTCKRRVKAAA